MVDLVRFVAAMTNKISIDGIEYEFPAQPGVLGQLTAEFKTENPDIRKVSGLVNDDLGLAAEVVKSANSPYFGVSGRIGSVQQAVYFLGLAQVFSLVNGVMLRRVFPRNDLLMDQLWDNSSTRGAIMARLARNVSVPMDRAYTVGLFQDCGVAVLSARFPNYRMTWEQICWLPSSTSVEQGEYKIDHPMLSALLVARWGLSEEIGHAVRLHHDIDQLDALEVTDQTKILVSLSVLANFVLARALSQNASLWKASFAQASTMLNVPLVVAEKWAEQASLYL